VFTKAIFFNLALQALLLSRQIVDTNSDKSNEAKVLNQIYDIAFKSALFDMDLDSTASQSNLELVTDFTVLPPPVNGQPGPLWNYAYKYPSNCAFFRKVVSCNVIDDKSTHIPKRILIEDGKKMILTNEQYAIGEFIATDFPIQTLSAPAGMTIALRLALMGAPLIVGKGAKTLMNEIRQRYIDSKAEAQALDSRESFSFQHDSNLSEFVKERMS
jgi:hypothetical protein